MQYYPVRGSLLMFGSEGSCSSSDGSCSQINHAREIKQEEMGFQNCMCSGFEDSNRFMFSYGSNNGGENINQLAEKPDGCLGESILDYGLEDIKQLISSTSNNGLFNIDENKTHEKVMYYY
ncbi:hypothetical protein L6164_019048 [Bauhinia variegata]|nr:hypothetical protein L6164_019048 [Bauhinia variegata]